MRFQRKVASPPPVKPACDHPAYGREVVPAHLTRRELLAAGAAGGAGLAFGGLGPSALRALAASARVRHSERHRARGDPDPGEPVVRPLLRLVPRRARVLRSAASRSRTDCTVWYQSDNGIMPAFGPPSGYLAPFHIDSFNAAGTGECTNDITHDWAPQHEAWNNGGDGSVPQRPTSTTPPTRPMRR